MADFYCNSLLSRGDSLIAQFAVRVLPAERAACQMQKVKALHQQPSLSKMKPMTVVSGLNANLHHHHVLQGKKMVKLIKCCIWQILSIKYQIFAK